MHLPAGAKRLSGAHYSDALPGTQLPQPKYNAPPMFYWFPNGQICPNRSAGMCHNPMPGPQTKDETENLRSSRNNLRLLLTPIGWSFAAPGEAAGEAGHGLDSTVLIGVAIMLIVAKLGGEIFERIGQPAALGELIGGIAVGNLVIFGLAGAELLKSNQIIAALPV